MRLAAKRAEAATRQAELRQSLKAAVHLSFLQNPALRRAAPKAVAVVAVLAILGNVFQYFRYSPSRPLVSVGRRVITRREYQASLDQAAGKAVLNRLVYEELVRQAAAKARVMPAPEVVEERLAGLKEHNGLAGTPTDRTSPAWQEATTDIALENLRMRGIPASDEEIAAFYAQHRNLYARPEKAGATVAVTANATDAAKAEGMLRQGWDRETIGKTPGIHVAGVNGFEVNFGALPVGLRNQIGPLVLSLHEGDVRTLPFGRVFFTFQGKAHDAGSQTPLSEVRDQVARQVRLQKAPDEPTELATLYKANPPAFDMDRYAAYFSDVASVPAPTAPKAAEPRKTASVP